MAKKLERKQKLLRLAPDTIDWIKAISESLNVSEGVVVDFAIRNYTGRDDIYEALTRRLNKISKAMDIEPEISTIEDDE